MSPRRNRPRPDRRGGRGAPERPGVPAELDVDRVRGGIDAIETWRGERWRVRHIPGSAAVKTYRCPGCDQEIRPGVPHLVVWQTDPIGAFGGEQDRRHWHTGCWRRRHAS